MSQPTPTRSQTLSPAALEIWQMPLARALGPLRLSGGTGGVGISLMQRRVVGWRPLPDWVDGTACAAVMRHALREHLDAAGRLGLWRRGSQARTRSRHGFGGGAGQGRGPRRPA